MTDTELVAAVADRIMGWPMFNGRLPGSPPPGQESPLWRPLESWEDAFTVVAAMRAKGWWYNHREERAYTEGRPPTCFFWFYFEDKCVGLSATALLDDATAQRRAICICALNAIRAINGKDGQGSI